MFEDRNALRGTAQLDVHIRDAPGYAASQIRLDVALRGRWRRRIDTSDGEMAERSRLEQAWFEMRDIQKRRVAESVWIPLRACSNIKTGKNGHAGHQDEFFGVGSLAVPISRVDEAEKIGWEDIGLLHQHGSYAFEATYKPADIYQYRNEVDFGVELILVQNFDGGEPNVWHLNQDVVFALKLLREGDIWICPTEGYIDVVRLERASNNSESSIVIRAEFLRDYLAARQMALRLVTYRSRSQTSNDADHISWPEGFTHSVEFGGRFEGRVVAIHQGGMPFGMTSAVFRTSRTDVDTELDVPTFENSEDASFESESWETRSVAPKLYRVEGEFWRNEWVQPAALSPRVRYDDLPSDCSFVVDAAGNRQTADELNHEDVGRWLWFTPEVINIIADRRGGSLTWLTRDTAAVSAYRGDEVNFGINSSGLVTVYAYDVARLPEWQRRIWMGFNVSPNGKVSAELLSAQVRAVASGTQAPEALLERERSNLADVFEAKWGRSLFQQHQDVENILRKANRLRSTDRTSLLAMAKDLARISADCFDIGALQAIVPPPTDTRLASLKSLEKVITSISSETEARAALKPLVGIYELRLGDAHLASKKIEDAFELGSGLID